VSEERLRIWSEKKVIEDKKFEGGTSDGRLIYYSDFYDLITILQKNWQDFKAVFGEWKETEVLLKLLSYFRNPDAHHRELLSHQKHLIIGIAGELRNRIIKYRSKMETGDDVFPRIESIRDNLGNVWVTGTKGRVKHKNVLRVGDTLEFVIAASDPLGGELNYSILNEIDWQKDNTLRITLGKEHIGRSQNFIMVILSEREYHASNESDDAVIFAYDILPSKIAS
jgi:hypothetical protein